MKCLNKNFRAVSLVRRVFTGFQFCRKLLLLSTIFVNFIPSAVAKGKESTENSEKFYLAVKRIFTASHSYLSSGHRVQYTLSGKFNGKKFRETVSLEIHKTDSDNLNVVVNPNEKVKGGYPCLNMTFSEVSEDFQTSGKRISFSASDVSSINRGKCALGHKEEVAGTFFVLLADQLNQDLFVKKSSLSDQSRILNQGVSLKAMNLILYNQTWYERVAGFRLKNEEIKGIAKELAFMTLYTALEASLRVPGKGLQEEIGYFQDFIYSNNIDSHQTLREFYNYVFSSELLSSGQKVKLWKFIFESIPFHINFYQALGTNQGDNDEILTMFNSWYQLQQHSSSVKVYDS